MSKRGKVTGTSASAEFLAANEYRGFVTIMLQDEVTCAFGFSGEDAVLDEGVILVEAGDSIEIKGELAREQINVIGDTASLTWQEGPLTVRRLGVTA